MPRRVKRIRHDEGFSKGHAESANTAAASTDPAQQQRDIETFLVQGRAAQCGVGGFRAKWDPADRL